MLGEDDDGFPKSEEYIRIHWSTQKQTLLNHTYGKNELRG
jgi:hypothetical protein